VLIALSHMEQDQRRLNPAVWRVVPNVATPNGTRPQPDVVAKKRPHLSRSRTVTRRPFWGRTTSRGIEGISIKHTSGSLQRTFTIPRCIMVQLFSGPRLAGDLEVPWIISVLIALAVGIIANLATPAFRRLKFRIAQSLASDQSRNDPLSRAYLRRFIGRARAPSWDAGIQEYERIKASRIRIGECSAPVEADVADDASETALSKRVRTVTLPTFLDEILFTEGWFPRPFCRNVLARTSSFFLESQRAAKSVVALQLTQLLALRAERSRRLPLPIYVHYGQDQPSESVNRQVCEHVTCGDDRLRRLSGRL
jgi:hypothetical protein